MTTEFRLIQTKLQRPLNGPGTLLRPALLQRLEEGRFRKLTLISAPSGYGKSVLASSWLESGDRRAAWLTLDKHDDDLVVFLLYLAGAIRTAYPEACAELLDLLNSVELPPVDLLADTLINETNSLPEHFLLVLDDYHVLHSREIHALVSRFVRYQSPQVHLVIITRQDPFINLTRLRAHGQLNEVRIGDLRFNRAETCEYLRNVLDRPVSDDFCSRLAERTEGWPAGLYLASLSLRHTDFATFLDGFHGTHRHIMTYLVDDVLERQPPDLQTFLLHTALLDRFCAPLCQVLLDGIPAAGPHHTGEELLGQLVQKGLFVVALDNEGHWYRYHQLFRELLLYRLEELTSPVRRTQLHLAVSEWFESQGAVQEALEHALLGEDKERVAQLVGAHRHYLMDHDHWRTLRIRLSQIPPQMIAQQPELLVAQAWIATYLFDFPGMERALAQLDALPLDQTLMSPRERQLLRGEIAAIRSMYLYWIGQPQAAVDSAKEALAVTPVEHQWTYGHAMEAQVMAQQALGRSDQAHTLVQQALAQVPLVHEATQCQLYTGRYVVELASANLHGAHEAARQVLRICQGERQRVSMGWAAETVGYAHYQWNDLEKAVEFYQKVLALRYHTNSGTQAHALFGLSRTYQALGRIMEAHEASEAAIGWAREVGNAYMLLEAEAWASQLALLQGRVPEVDHWAAPLGETLLTMLFIESPQLILAKTLVAHGTAESWEQADRLLNRLRGVAESTHNLWRLAEIRAVQALLYHAQGERPAALSSLESALRLTQPGGFLRLYVDLDPALAGLLQQLRTRQPDLAPYITQILNAFDPVPDPQARTRRAEPATLAAQDGAVTVELVEGLTFRETDVLELLAQRLTNREIAEQLYISPSTVKQHLHNIYQKLNVSNRRQAVAVATSLGLLAAD